MKSIGFYWQLKIILISTSRKLYQIDSGRLSSLEQDERTILIGTLKKTWKFKSKFFTVIQHLTQLDHWTQEENQLLWWCKRVCRKWIWCELNFKCVNYDYLYIQNKPFFTMCECCYPTIQYETKNNLHNRASTFLSALDPK
jgi:hypothetical protein